MAKMAHIRTSSKRFLAFTELLKGVPVAEVVSKYGEATTGWARVIIQYHTEAQKTISTQMSLKPTSSDLIGCEKYINQIVHLVNYGDKAIFLGGYHGLGKTSLVYKAAKQFDAEIIRLQVTEMLSEVDIIGGPDPQTGEFILSEFVKQILKAKENPDKTYFLLLDEFTRGRPEALNVLFPILAEKTLFNNSVYAKKEHKVIAVPDNVKMLGTGNVNDKGMREVGEAEFDRWNGIEILPIKNKAQLKLMIKKHSNLTDTAVIDKLIEYYLLSWQYSDEMRILPMSHRTIIQTAVLVARSLLKGGNKHQILSDTLDLTYLTASQAIINPNFRQTYKQMIREVL